MKKYICLFLLFPTLCFSQAIFGPSPGGPVSLVASTTTNSVAVPNPNSENQVRVFSACDTILYFKTGNSGVTATSADWALAPNSVEIFSLAAVATHIAVLVPSGTCTVYVTRGTGL